MKRMKKFLAFVLSMIMCLGMTVTAFAAEAPTLGSGDGTITISNVTKGQKYTAYKIFEASVSESGAISYTASAEQKAKFETAVNATVTAPDVAKVNPFNFIPTASGTYIVEIGVKEAEVKDSEGNVTSPAVYYNGEDVAKFFSKIQNKSDGTEGTETVFDVELLESLALGKVTKELEEAAAANASIKMNVPYGYYVITSGLGATLTVDSTNPNAVVIDKNQTGPSWDEKTGKVIVNADGTTTQVNSANYGDVIDFKITLDTTNYDGKEFINNYYIQDKLSKGFTYVTKNADGSITDGLKVKVTVGTKELSQGSGYTVSNVTYDATDGEDQNSTGFVVDIPWVNTITKDDKETVDKDQNGNPIFKYVSPNKITIEYSVQVNGDAEIAGKDADKNTNTASYTYTKLEDLNQPNPKVDYEEKTSTTETYVFALAINKVDPSGNSLEGAEFTLGLKTAANTVVPVSVKATNEKGVYVKCAESDTDKVESVITPDTGVIVIKGVAEGEYVLTETKAPVGYNLLEKSVSVKASMTEKTTYTTTKYYKVVDGEVSELTDNTEEGVKILTTTVPVKAITVVNNIGSLLPSTGGIGTTIFYVVGGLLVAGAGILLITKKRMKKEQ